MQVSYLLGNTINPLMKHITQLEYNGVYFHECLCIQVSKNILYKKVGGV